MVDSAGTLGYGGEFDCVGLSRLAIKKLLFFFSFLYSVLFLNYQMLIEITRCC